MIVTTRLRNGTQINSSFPLYTHSIPTMLSTAFAMVHAEILNRALEDGIPISPDLYMHARLAKLAKQQSADQAARVAFLNKDSQLDRRYRTMEAAALRLQKEAKGYLDSLRGMMIYSTQFGFHFSIYRLIKIAMTASQMRIAETIDAFYGDAGAKDGVSRSYKQAVEDLDTETIKALDGPYRYVRISCYKTSTNSRQHYCPRPNLPVLRLLP